MNRFQFILESFGLQQLRTRAYEFVKQEVVTDEAIGTSAIDTPVFDNVILQDTDQNPTIQLRIDAVLIDAALPKNIVKTPLNGRNGTIKEYISDSDWIVTFRGSLWSGKIDVFPKDDFDTLVRLCKIQKELVVVSKFLQMLGVHNLVVERASFPQREGYWSNPLFEIQCASDIPVELIENEK